MSTQDNMKKVVQEIYAAFVRGDIPFILNTLPDNVELHEPPGGEPPTKGTYYGRNGVGQFLQALAEAMEVRAFEPREFFAQGDIVVALGHYCFYVKKTGKSYETDWAMAWWFRDGKVVKIQVFKDSATEAAALRGT